MKKICLSLLISITFTSVAVWAGTGSIKGNGGFVVQCSTPTGMTYQTLDLFEAEKNREFKLLTFEDTSALNIALRVVDQLSKVSPQRANEYKKRLREFEADTLFVSDANFTDVHDAYPVYLPNNCSLTPAAIQTRFALPGEHKYYVSNEIWSKLSPLNQASLMVHEVVFMEFGHELSVLTRSFVGLIFSEQFEKNYAVADKFLDLLIRVKAPYYEQSGLMVDLRAPFEEHAETGVIKTGRVLAGKYTTAGSSLSYASAEVSFYKNGSPIFLKLDEDNQNYITLKCLGITQVKNTYDGKAYFYKTGAIWKADFIALQTDFVNDCREQYFEIDPQEAKEYIQEDEKLGFYGNFEFTPEGQLLSSEGLRVTFAQGNSPFTLRGKIIFGADLQPQSGILATPANLNSPLGVFSALEDRPVKFSSDRLLQCGTAREDQAFEDDLRLYRVHAKQEFCFR